MLEIVLHSGNEHVNLWLVLLPALAAFIGGLGLGWRSRTQGGKDPESIDGTGEPTDDSHTQ